MMQPQPGEGVAMPYNIDDDRYNPDWAKRPWDFRGSPQEQADQIVRPSWPLTMQQEQLDWFMGVPASRSMPEQVKQVLRARGLRLPEYE
jgi:hypothetical protein